MGIALAEPEMMMPKDAAVTVSAASRQAYADVLRTFAAFAVVVIHVSGQGVVHQELESRFSWWIANCFDAASQWAVPCFIMVSGALLLGSSSNEGMGKFYLKRLVRVGIPLVFWSAFYMLVWQMWYQNLKLTWPQVRNALLTGTPEFHLYFMFLICGLYLFTPMLRTFVRHASDAEVWTAAVLSMVLSCATYMARAHYFGSQRLATDMYLPYVGYFLLGYAIVHRRVGMIWRKIWRTLAWIALPGAYLTIVLAVGHGHARGDAKMNSAIALYYEHFTPTMIIMTLSIFAIAVDVYDRHGPVRDRVAWVCRWIAPATFGIYLVHVILLGESFRWGMPVYPNTLISIPFWSTAIFVGSLVITKIIQVLDLRRVVG